MNKKFYSVQVGINTRAGNLQVHHSFVVGVPAGKHRYDVHNHYVKQYAGLNVGVSEIKDVLFSDIPDKKAPVPDKVMTPKVKRFRSIEHYIYKSRTSDATQELWNVAKTAQEDASVKKEALINSICLDVNSFYNGVTGDVRIDDEKFNVLCGDVHFSASLKGTIVMEEIEKTLK